MTVAKQNDRTTRLPANVLFVSVQEDLGIWSRYLLLGWRVSAHPKCELCTHRKQLHLDMVPNDLQVVMDHT
jgi:hypothetical protein